MQVFAHLPLESHMNRWGHLRQRYESGKFEVLKLFGPVHGSMARRDRGRSYIYAHIKVPPHVSNRVEGWRIQADGSCRLAIEVSPNFEVLAPFLASGDSEWDLRDKS